MDQLSDTIGPIVLGNAPSCGSTLLRVLLGRHPAIFAGGELAILDKPSLLGDAQSRYAEQISKWLANGYPAEFVGASSQVFEQLDDYKWNRRQLALMCSSSTSFQEMLNTFYSRELLSCGARRWLEKTPCNIYSFRQVADMFPNAKFIHITRDARDSIASYCRREKSVFKAVSRWYYATLTGIQYRVWPNYYELKYEDLVQSTEVKLRAICAFLGEPFHEVMLDKLEKYGRGPTTWLQDPGEEVTDKGVGQFKQHLTQEQRSVFNHVALSTLGLDQLPFGGTTTGVFSPVELQNYLGYGTEVLTDEVTMSKQDLLSHWNDFLAHQQHTDRLYGRRLTCHTKLIYRK